MKYTGLFCDGCGLQFNDTDDVVVCPECGTPQHRDCWMKEKKCVSADKHSDEFSWVMPDWKKAENEPEKAEPKKLKTDADEFAEHIKFKNDEGAVVCPHCNEFNYSNDAFCRRCHKPLRELPEEFNNNNNGEENPFNEIFGEPTDSYGNTEADMRRDIEYFNRFGGLAPDAEIDEIPVSELSQYIGGKRPGRMIRRFAMMDRSGRKFSLNPAALFFGPAWFLYRKMTKWGFLFLAVLLIASPFTVDAIINYDQYVAQYSAIVEYMLENMEKWQSGEISSEDYTNGYEAINSAVASENSETTAYGDIVGILAESLCFGIWMCMGFLSDRLYRKKIKNDVINIRERNDNMDSYYNDLEKTGKGSVPMTVVGLILTGVALFGPSYAIVFSVIIKAFS